MNDAAISIADAFGISVLGFAIVFFVLVVLMVVINVLRSVLEQMDSSRQAVPAAASAPSAPAAPSGPPSNMVPATGSLGEIKLFDVEDRTAALIMAIVADEMGAPLNELRFLSIREKR